MSPLCCHRCCRDGELRSSSYWAAPSSSPAAVGFDSLSLVLSWFRFAAVSYPVVLPLRLLFVLPSVVVSSSFPPFSSHRRLVALSSVVFPSIVSSSCLSSPCSSHPPLLPCQHSFPLLPPPPYRCPFPFPLLVVFVITSPCHPSSVVVLGSRLVLVAGSQASVRGREIENEPRQRSWLVFRNSQWGIPRVFLIFLLSQIPLRARLSRAHPFGKRVGLGYIPRS